MQFMKRMACLLVFASMFISVSDQRLECRAMVCQELWRLGWICGGRVVYFAVVFRFACRRRPGFVDSGLWVIGLSCYIFFCISSSLYGGRSGCASGVN